MRTVWAVLIACAAATAAADGNAEKAATAKAKTDAKSGAKVGSTGDKPVVPSRSKSDEAGSDAATGSNAKAEDDAPADETSRIPHVVGPKLVDLGSNTEIQVPAGMWLFER